MSENVVKTNVEELLRLARQRAQVLCKPYAGDLTPPEAWALFKSGAAILVDVRTEEELKFVGRVPDAPHVAWKFGPDMRQNFDFVQDIEDIAPKETVLLLLCRSGVRSVAAAIELTQAGFAHTFNILEGFEGEMDSEQRRGTFNGWRFHGLPSIQNQ